MTELLRVENLHVSVGKKELLHGINLTVNKGEVHVIMGINGAGKSTLLHAIMGNPVYTITEGRIFFEGQDITELSVDKRAKLGIFLSFQNPISVAGITTENFIRTAKTTISGKQQRLFPFKRLMKSRMEDLAMDPSYAERYLNDGFSGGERKKSEILRCASWIRSWLCLMKQTPVWTSMLSASFPATFPNTTMKIIHF